MTQLLGAKLDGDTGGAIPHTDGSEAKDYTDLTKTLPTMNDTTKHIQIDLLSAVRTMMADDAANSYKQLDTLVRMGMMRVVVTDGHILTKMNFIMKAAAATQANSQDIYGSSFAGHASVGAAWGWGAASLGASYSNFSVHVADEHSQTSTDIQLALMGEVLVNFKSDYFPQLPSQAKP